MRCLLAALALMAVGTAFAQDGNTAAGLSESQRLQQLDEDVSREAERAQRELEAARDALRAEERSLSADGISAATLEQARVEVAARRSRLSSLRTRLLARREALRQVDDDRAVIRDDLEVIGNGEARLQLDGEMSELDAQARALQQLIDRLDELRAVARQRVDLATQRLTLLQSRFQLPDLDARPRPATPASRQAQATIDTLLREAAQLRDAVANQPEVPAASLARRRLLELQANDREERAELAQTRLRMDRANRILATLESFTRAASTPLRVLREGRDSVEALRDELRVTRQNLLRNGADLEDQRGIIRQQGEIASGADSTLQDRVSLLDALISESGDVAKYVDGTLARVDAVKQRYDMAVADAGQRELLERRPLPQGTYAWAALGSGLLSLPGDIVGAVGHAFARGWRRLREADGERILAVFGVLALAAALAVIGRWGLLKLSAMARGTARLVLREAGHLAPGLLAITAVLLCGRLLDLADRDRALLTLLFAIWPAVVVVRRTSGALSEYFAAFAEPSEQARFARMLRWVLAIGGVLAGVLAMAHVVALSPKVSDAADRLSMLVLLILIVPVLRLRRLVIKRTDADSRLIRQVSALLPLLMLGVAITGLLGFVNLAWALAAGLAMVLAVAVLFGATRAVLSQGHETVVHKLESNNAESAAFWSGNVVGPIYRILQLLLVVAAVLVAGRLLGWSADTPVIRSIPGLLDMTLFSIGASPIKLSNLVAAVVMVWLVFWAAGWSKQVSYRVAAGKFADVGIRNSLSTFTQYAVVVFGLMVALRTIGLDLTALTVFAGALGVGIGFGMQTIVTNFISGILLLIERPLAVKDIVNVDKYEGEVTQIGIRSLTVKTWDAQEVIIPNSAVITKPFTNWTRSDDTMRTVLHLRVDYDADLEQAQAICREVVAAHEAVLESPAPAVRIWEFLDTGVHIWVQFHSKIRGSVGRADLRSQLNLAMWKALREAGIRIPYPRHEVAVTGRGTEGEPQPA